MGLKKRQISEVESEPVKVSGAVFVEPETPKLPKRPLRDRIQYVTQLVHAIYINIIKPVIRIASIFFALYIAWLALKWVSYSEWANPAVSQVRIEAPFVWRSESAIKHHLAEVLSEQRFWTLDVHRIRNHLQKDPALRSVRVQKAWPNQLLVRIEEMVPVARWGEKHLLTELGRVVPLSLLEPNNEAQSEVTKTLQFAVQLQDNEAKPSLKLPLLLGGKHNGAVLIERYRLLRRLGWQIAQLELTPRGAWKVRLTDGLKIDLGSQHFSERVHKVATIMQAYRERLKTMQKIDARYPNGVAIKWRPESVQATEALPVRG